MFMYFLQIKMLNYNSNTYLFNCNKVNRRWGTANQMSLRQLVSTNSAEQFLISTIIMVLHILIQFNIRKINGVLWLSRFNTSNPFVLALYEQDLVEHFSKLAYLENYYHELNNDFWTSLNKKSISVLNSHIILKTNNTLHVNLRDSYINMSVKQLNVNWRGASIKGVPREPKGHNCCRNWRDMLSH